MSYAMYHTKSDTKGLVCIFVIVLQNCYLAVTNRMQKTISYQVYGHIFDQNNPVFGKTNSLGNNLDNRQKNILCSPVAVFYNLNNKLTWGDVLRSIP